MVSKENKKLIFGIILAALVFLSYQVIASYMTNPVDSSLKYPNPGHYPGEIGPGTFNASNSANPYWSFPDSSGDRFTGLEIRNGSGQFYKTLQVFNNFYTYANTYLGDDSSDKTIVKGDLNVTGGIVVGNPDEGNKGPGTINAEKIYVNGSEVGGKIKVWAGSDSDTDYQYWPNDCEVSCKVSVPEGYTVIYAHKKCSAGNGCDYCDQVTHCAYPSFLDCGGKNLYYFYACDPTNLGDVGPINITTSCKATSAPYFCKAGCGIYVIAIKIE